MLLVPPLLAVLLLLLLEPHPGQAQPAGEAPARPNILKRLRPEVAHTETPVSPPSDSTTTTSPSSTPTTTSESSSASASDDIFAPTAHVANIAHVESSVGPPASPTTATSKSSSAGDSSHSHTDEHVESTSTPSTTALVTDPVGTQPAIAHTESAVPTTTSTPDTTLEAPSPHVETTAPPTPTATYYSAHTEQPVPPSDSTPVAAPKAHTESAAPSDESSIGGGGLPGAIASAAQGATGATMKGSSPSQPQAEHDVTASQAPTSVALPTEVPIPVGSGSVHIGSQDVSVGAIAIPASKGASAVSAVVIGSHTAAAGQTLTIGSSAVVVSESSGSLFLQPAWTPTASASVEVSAEASQGRSTEAPSVAHVTAVLTEGSKLETEVFAATTNSAGSLVAVTNVEESAAPTAAPSHSKSASSAAATSNSSETKLSSASTTLQITSSTSTGGAAPSSTTTAGSPRTMETSMPLVLATLVGMAASMLLLT